MHKAFDVQTAYGLNGKYIVPVHSIFKKWVKLDGLEYKEGNVICTDIHDEQPVFCKIFKICLIEDDVCFLVNEFITVFMSISMHMKLIWVKKVTLSLH